MVFMMAMHKAGPYERWPKTLKVELEKNTRKPRDLVGNNDSLKRVNYSFSGYGEEER